MVIAAGDNVDAINAPLTFAIPRNFFARFFLSLRSFRPALSFFLASARPNCERYTCQQALPSLLEWTGARSKRGKASGRDSGM